MRGLQPDLTWLGQQGVAQGEFVVAISRDELSLLANAITEALEAVEEWEFETRLGATRDHAKVLRTRLKELRHSYQPE